MRRRRLLFPLLALAVAALTWWWDARSEPTPKPLRGPPSIPYEGPLGMSPRTKAPGGPDATRTGSVRGRCRLAGPAEVQRFDPGMAEGDVDSPRMLVGEGLALGNCLVFTDGFARDAATPREAEGSESPTAWIELRPEGFEPHVSWVRPGTRIGLRSLLRGPINVHAFRGTTRAETQFNVAVEPGGALGDFAQGILSAPGVYLVSDDYRGGYAAYVHVLDGAAVAVTSDRPDPTRGLAAGEYLLEGVAEGRRDVVAWHEGMYVSKDVVEGRVRTYRPSDDLRLTRTVVVEPGATVTVDFVFPAPVAADSPAGR